MNRISFVGGLCLFLFFFAFLRVFIFNLVISCKNQKKKKVDHKKK